MLLPEDAGPNVLSAPLDRIQLSQFAIDRYLEEPDIGMYEDLDPAPEPDDVLEDETEITPDAGIYRDFIVKTPAYSWLLATLQREATLSRATPDLMDNIREIILGALPSYRKVSRKAPSQEYKATFELDWNPLSFVKEQQYRESPDEALERAITLTGSANDAQALTTMAYLSQTWPATGEYVMRLVKNVARNTIDHHVLCK